MTQEEESRLRDIENERLSPNLSPDLRPVRAAAFEGLENAILDRSFTDYPTTKVYTAEDLARRVDLLTSYVRALLDRVNLLDQCRVIDQAHSEGISLAVVHPSNDPHPLSGKRY